MNKPISTWCIISMASIPLVMTLGNSMLIPVLPIFEKQLNISSFQSSLIITVYSIAAIFLIPIAGYLSDRIGRKKVIVPSLLLTLIGGISCGISFCIYKRSIYLDLNWEGLTRVWCRRGCANRFTARWRSL
ncbi:MFS transporter [Piscibacillus salipiscarius]|uniref:MFS transporter n=1 Tax=Piscibacillus salipiscarius TaxID=299480 RepID=UPI0034E1E251